MSRKVSNTMRSIHRYLGFFLAGIMAVYSLSGMVLIFRDTDFLKKNIETNTTIAANLDNSTLGKTLKIRNFKVEKTDGDHVTFKGGTYDKSSGNVKLIKKELPYVLGKMTHLHKAKSSQPLFFLNIFFGLSLFFFVVSSFWMFMPSTSVFKKGMVFTLVGVILTLILLFI